MTDEDRHTRLATWEDVLDPARHFEQHGASRALIGGYAIAAHGFVRFSEDVDGLVEPSAGNTARWISALAELPDHAAAELAGREHLFDEEGPYALRINDEFTVDVMPAVRGHGWAELAPFVVIHDVDGVRLPVLGLAGLLLTEEGLRDRDRADAAVLRAVIQRLSATPP